MSEFENIKQKLSSFKAEMESTIPFVKSELIDLVKPTMMGTSGIYYCFDSKEGTGIAIYFWNTGIFEIASDIIVGNLDDSFQFSYIPQQTENVSYAKESVRVFLEKLSELEAKIKGNF